MESDRMSQRQRTNERYNRIRSQPNAATRSRGILSHFRDCVTPQPTIDSGVGILDISDNDSYPEGLGERRRSLSERDAAILAAANAMTEPRPDFHPSPPPTSGLVQPQFETHAPVTNRAVADVVEGVPVVLCEPSITDLDVSDIVLSPYTTSTPKRPDVGPTKRPGTEPGRYQRAFMSSGMSLAVYTFALNLCLHVLSFALNALAYRRLDIASIGLVNVRLGLYYSTLIFLSREAFRKACLSRGGELSSSGPLGRTVEPSVRRQWRSLFTTAWLVVPLGFALALLCFPIWLYLLPPPGQMALAAGDSADKASRFQRQYTHCLMVYTLAALFELCTEPFWLLFQLSHLVRLRVGLELAANMSRVVGLLVLLFNWSPDSAVYILALPQILHGGTLLFLYIVVVWYQFYRCKALLQMQQALPFEGCDGIARYSDILPNLEASGDQAVITLVTNLFSQNVLKQILTEGERYLITAFNLASFTEQGLYDLVSNLGSLAARTLFAPLEESCHFVFGQCIARDVQPTNQDPVRISDALRMLRVALRFSSLAAWIGLIFAQTNSYLLLFYYVGPSVADNPVAVNLLRIYSAYVLLLAWNGSTEAFLHAAMSASHGQIVEHNWRLVKFTIFYLTSNFLLVPFLGIYGYILANCINMMLRIVFSYIYIAEFLVLLVNPAISLAQNMRRETVPATSTEILATLSEFTKQRLANAAAEVLQGRPVPSVAPRSSNPPNNSINYEVAKMVEQRTYLASLMTPSHMQTVLLGIGLALTMYTQTNFCCSVPIVFWHLSATASVLLLLAVDIYYEEADLVELLLKRPRPSVSHQPVSSLRMKYD